MTDTLIYWPSGSWKTIFTIWELISMNIKENTNLYVFWNDDLLKWIDVIKWNKKKFWINQKDALELFNTIFNISRSDFVLREGANRDTSIFIIDEFHSFRNFIVESVMNEWWTKEFFDDIFRSLFARKQEKSKLSFFIVVQTIELPDNLNLVKNIDNAYIGKGVSYIPSEYNLSEDVKTDLLDWDIKNGYNKHSFYDIWANIYRYISSDDFMKINIKIKKV